MDVSTKLEMMDSDGFAQVRRILSQLGENSRELMNQGELLELLILYLRGRVAVITAGRGQSATESQRDPRFLVYCIYSPPVLSVGFLSKQQWPLTQASNQSSVTAKCLLAG